MKTVNYLFRWLAIYIFSSTFFSCVYSPSDFTETYVEPPSETGDTLFMTLNDAMDVIYIGWVTNFAYQISGTDKHIYSVEIDFEGQQLHSYINEYGQTMNFTLDPASYSDGYHELNIKIITSTGTGSIADKSGAEGYIYELNWPVIIDKTIPDNINDYKITAERTDKGIRLNWNTFEHANFQSYQIARQTPPYEMEAVPITTIYDPETSTFLDTTFYEGQAMSYTLWINTPAGKFVSNGIWVHDKLTGLKAEWHPDGTVDFNWNKTICPAVFGNYYVYSGFDYSNLVEEYLIDDPEENHVQLQKAGLGNDLYIFLKFLPKGMSKEEAGQFSYQQHRLSTPSIFSQYQKAINVPRQDYVLLCTDKMIYKYDPEKIETISSFPVTINSDWYTTVSNDGQKVAYYSKPKFVVRKIADWSLVNEWNDVDAGSDKHFIVSCSMSDNDKLAALDEKGKVNLYNLITGELLDSETIEINDLKPGKCVLSPDGTKLVAMVDYWYNQFAYYNLNNDGWYKMAQVTTPSTDVFYSADGQQVVLAGFNQIQIRNVSDFSLQISYPMPDGYFRTADRDNSRFLWDPATGNSYTSLLFDLKTGTVLDSIIVGNGYSKCLSGNHILSGSGTQLNFSDPKE